MAPGTVIVGSVVAAGVAAAGAADFDDPPMSQLSFGNVTSLNAGVTSL